MGHITELRKRPKPKALAWYQRAHDDERLPVHPRRRLKARARLLRRAVDLDHTYAAAWAALTRTYWQLAKTAHADVAFRHAVALDPFLAGLAALNTAIDANNACRYEEALAWNNRAIALAPEMKLSWYHKTVILRNMATFRDERYWKDVLVAAEQNLKRGGFFLFAYDYRDDALRELRAQAERARAAEKVVAFHRRETPGTD